MTFRLHLVIACALLWVAALGARLWYLQVERHEDYRTRAAHQQRRVLDLEPPRGTIFDARGRVLAVSMEVESVFAEPRQIKDAGATALRLAQVLPVEASGLERRLRAQRSFVFVARKLDPPQAEAVRALGLPGIHFLRESKRYYPMRELGAPLLGFVGTDHVGLAGLEAHYDALVAGTAGRRTVLRDARRRDLLSPRLSQVEAKPGQDLHLTLDATVQLIVEKELGAAVERYRARAGTAVVLDPGSGAVLAMASTPGFDPNRFGDFPAASWRNSAVMDAFEPGSTFKLVTTAAVLAHGLLGPDDLLDCNMGGITLAGQRIRDHRPFGVMPVRQVFARSSNVGTIRMGLLLGDRRLLEAIRAFGFGRRTGIDLPGESPGIVRPAASWSPLSKAYVSFGQEIAVTPLQLTRATAAVANGGLLVQPHVVAAVGRGESRKLEPRKRDPPERVLAPDVAHSLATLMGEVVQEGTGRRARIEGYTVGGKTGTAQKVIDGRYSRSRYVASFVGFAPLEEPRLVALVVLDEPRPAYHGGEVAAPTFAAMARQILLYWGVPPSPGPTPSRPALPRELPEPSGVLLAELPSSEGSSLSAPSALATEPLAPPLPASLPPLAQPHRERDAEAAGELGGRH
jgi:cell division protein FtsI (penicillin-binding protein 3)